MRAKRLAFNANRAPINPPAQVVVDELIKLSKNVAKLAATRAQASAIVNVAGKAIGDFSKIQGQ
jgi:hypothetical protein